MSMEIINVPPTNPSRVIFNQLKSQYSHLLLRSTAVKNPTTLRQLVAFSFLGGAHLKYFDNNIFPFFVFFGTKTLDMHFYKL